MGGIPRKLNFEATATLLCIVKVIVAVFEI